MNNRIAIHITLCLIVMVGLISAPVEAESTALSIDKDASVFGVVIHRGGIAAGLAHDHFITAADFEYTLAITDNNLESCEFTMTMPVDKLIADDPDAKKRWYPAIHEKKLLDTPFGELSPNNRATIRKHMLAKNQLDAANHKTITAKVTKVAKDGDNDNYTVTLEFTVHGQTVTRDVPARITWADSQLIVKAFGSFKFTEFGIEPYSTAFGAVKNRDEFDLFVHLEATTKPSP